MRKSCRVQRCCSAAGQPRGSERRFSFSEWVFGGGGVACCSALAPWGRCGAQGLCSAAGDALCPPTQDPLFHLTEAPCLPLESCRRIWICPGGMWGRPGSSGLIQKSLEMSQRSLGAFRESSCGCGGFWIPRTGLEMSWRCFGETRGSWSPPGVSKTDGSHQKKPPYGHQACLQPDLVTLELSGAATIMCHKDGDVVVYSAATRGDRVLQGRTAVIAAGCCFCQHAWGVTAGDTSVSPLPCHTPKLEAPLCRSPGVRPSDCIVPMGGGWS
ncbi:uncharacterized protein LOC121111853 [Gallus gallus]|uniref:uncharacterized protein LOC121111853 n=1 Tax=Gallus gallus TaxID=9031 RepID=UPI001AE39DB8|nr:uncharacterized protein LOC121111853 [Gallus gallus]